MKISKIYTLILISLPLLFAGCEKIKVVDRAAEAELVGARVRLYNFAIGGVTVNFYSNETKISAVASSTQSEAITGTNFGGTFPNNQYALAPVGNRSILAVTPKNLTTNGNITIATIPGNFLEGKYYSVFTCGIYNTLDKTSEGFMVEDNFPIELDATSAYIRIVNPCPNSNIRLVLQKTQTVGGVKTVLEEVEVGNGIEYKKASSFVKIPPGAWELLATDLTTSKTAVRAATSFLKERVYTIALRGNIVTGTPATFLDNTINK